MIKLLVSFLLLMTPWQSSFKEAADLYKQGQYVSAAYLFRSLAPDQAADRATVATYILLCEIGMEDPGASLHAAQWERDYPAAPLKQQVYLKLGNLLMQQSQYEKALAAYGKIRERLLPRKERAQYNFRMGYAYRELDRDTEALRYFQQTLTCPAGEDYKQAARFYTGYLFYSNQQFEEAIPLLDPLCRSPKYAPLAGAYLLQSRFYLKQYEEVIRQGEALYAVALPDSRGTLAKILSESYFALQRTQEARAFFDRYQQQATELTRTDRYYSGILDYVLGNYEQSVQQLSLAAGVSDSLGQNALYHLGEAYIELKNKIDALDAFQKAGNMDYDPAIKEDASFNYAKLSYDVRGDIQAISAYRQHYPQSPKLDELQNYIAAHSFLTQDYAGAVEALQAIKNPTVQNQEHLVRAAYLRGLQLYQAGSYRKAEPYFSLAKESYWVAECLYRSGSYANAITLWKQYIGRSTAASDPDKYRNSHFNIAYAYFKQQDYTTAADWFNRYLKLGRLNRSYMADSYLRLGDCAFAQHQYQEAADSYTLALNNRTIHPDYALYQIAMAQGVINQKDLKVATLDSLMQDYPSSGFFGAALYEKGRTYVQTTQYDLAQENFRQILENPDLQAYHAKALVELGMIEINTQHPEQAMTYYKEVMARYPDSADATNALAGIENLYLSQNNAAGYFAYMESLGIPSDKTTTEKEQLIFSSAEQLYLAGTYAAAVTALRKFIAEYPQSTQGSAAWFYLGECLSKLDKQEEAADAYLKVMEAQMGSFSELATLHYATLQYQMEKYADAADAYLSLNQIAQLENNKVQAQRGLMQACFMNKQYRNAVSHAKKVLDGEAFDAQDKANARYISAKSYLALGDRQAALPLLEEMAREPQYAIGAEAAFLLCKDAFDSGDFDRSETLIYNFADSDTPQDYWIAQAYLLLGDIFAERGEWVQARATYESVQKDYKPAESDDIAQLVAIRLKRCDEHNE